MSTLRGMVLLATFPFVSLSEEAEWIGVPDVLDPAVAKTFCVSAGLTSAVLKVTGVGYYEVRINGRKVGRKVLDPTPTDYSRRVFYSTYDVSGSLHSGTNEIRILLGNGLYNVQSEAAWKFNQAPWRGAPRGIATLDLAFADGSMSRVVTDSSWRVVPSPVAFNDFREGEVVLSCPEAASQTRNAEEMSAPGGKLVHAEHPGAEIVREYPVVAVETLPDGSTLYDFGFNIAGWARIRFSGLARGDVVSIRYDERHPSEGKRHIDAHVRKIASPGLCKTVDPSSAGFQTDRFVSAGLDEEIYEPRFTYNGFRYAIVKGARKAPPSRNVTGCFVRTAFPKTGSFACDNAVFNKLIAAAELAYESNFTDGIPTDCPHREKNGWLGDAAAAIELSQYAYGSRENALTYAAWLETIADQQKDDGRIACIAPMSCRWGMNAFSCRSGPAWGIAFTTIPYALYRFRGDDSVMRRLYPAMRRYADKLASELNPLCTHGLGDWVAVKLNRSGDLGSCRTTIPFTSSAYAYRTFREMHEMAEILGKAEDTAHFKRIAEKLRGDFNAAFYKGDGLYENGYACGQAMSLEFGLAPEGEVQAVRRRLVEAVHAEDDKIDFGLLGSTVVFRALSEAGETDLAWKMIMNESYPGFANWIVNGATTLWESWNGKSSRNHIMFGDFAAWAYAYIAGVKPLEPGFAKFEVRPRPPSALGFVCARIPTPHGEISVEWRRCGAEALKVRVSVPQGRVGVVVMPDGSSREVGFGEHVIECNVASSANLVSSPAAVGLRQESPSDWVDMRIGTARAKGSNVLGPCVPHGSAHPSPDSAWPSPHERPKDAKHGFGPPTSGWWPGDKVVGFSQLHAQGTGGTPSYGIFRYVLEPDDMEIVEARPYFLKVKLKQSGLLVDMSATAHGAIYHVRRSDGSPVILPLDRRCKLAKDDCVNEKGEFTGNWNPAPYRCHAYEETDAASGIHRIAVSFKSEEQAKAYFDAELAGKTVDNIADEARRLWNAALSRITIEGVDDSERRRFYSQLAQTFIQPRDRTADGIGWDDHYTLWDTWRTLFPLMAIVDPDSLAANVNAFADRFDRNGRCDSCYTQGKDYKVGQGGDEADCVIADAWAKKIAGIDWSRVVPLLESRWSGRTCEYREKGYAVGGAREGYCWRFKSGSATMSFAYQDWCCAEVLGGMGKLELAARFRERSGNWTNVWDDSAVDAPSGICGFARARLVDGSFTKTDPRKGFNTDFYEANCWEYSLFVPHDMAALVVRCGGKDAFRDRLSYALENGLVDFGNEPGFLVPWLFAYVGRGDLAARGAREVAKLFAGDDLPGDNDSGAMSALYVFLKLGFFPVAGQDIYIMHGCAYPRVDILLPGGKAFVIRTTGSGDAVKSVTLNGHPHDPLFLPHSEIASGGELVFVK